MLPVSAAELDGLLLDDHLPAILLRLLLRQGVPVRRLAQFVEPPDSIVEKCSYEITSEQDRIRIQTDLWRSPSGRTQAILMPASRHFLKRQNWQLFLVVRLISHDSPFVQKNIS